MGSEDLDSGTPAYLLINFLFLIFTFYIRALIEQLLTQNEPRSELL